MKAKIFKPAFLALTALLTVSAAGFAQEKPAVTTVQSNMFPDTLKFNGNAFQLKMNDLNINLNFNLNNLVTKLNNIAPQINLELNDLNLDDVAPNVNIDLKGLDNLNFNLNNIVPKIDLEFNDIEKSAPENDKNQAVSPKIEKIKNYSKSYPIDGNDRIKLSNQYGKIAVTTWDRHEVKVDVQIKATAGDDDEAQKLLDGVNIRDSKEGDQVSFKTSIAPNNPGYWKILGLGSKKSHKIEVNYTVYMPAKTDLNVEDSYGAITLPDLDGKIKISSSYGSVSAENLTNPANEISGSYGSLKIGSLNGGRLDFSYGSVDIDECNNLKADLSYGSFKLGKLKGAADMDLSYVGGFKIEEVSNSFKRLNVNSSYSGVSLGVPVNNNFDFDITTSYGGFSYNDDKVTITSKTPPDGSKHVSMTKNYKGHVGKGSAEAQVNIHTTYGGVTFEQ
jgi:hypothetical protein